MPAPRKFSFRRTLLYLKVHIQCAQFEATRLDPPAWTVISVSSIVSDKLCREAIGTEEPYPFSRVQIEGRPGGD